MASRSRRSVKKGVNLTVMVVGSSGLGKSTFINTLLDMDLFPNAGTKLNKGPPTTTDIAVHSTEIEEGNQKISLNIIDTPGFGDQINNEAWFDKIKQYLELQYEQYLEEESRIKRNTKFQDTRVHALLYFISPSGHALRAIDIEFMKRLAPTVNIIPVIAKADTLLPSELVDFKKRIMEDIQHFGIKIYNFPFDPEDDEEIIAENKKLAASLPFTVIGSEGTFPIKGDKVRGRKYPWGIVEVDNPDHCEVDKLRGILFETHLEDLKDTTHAVLYEEWRTQKLSTGEMRPSGSLHFDHFEQTAQKKEELLSKEEQLRRESEMIELQRQMLKEKEAELSMMQKKLSTADLQN